MASALELLTALALAAFLCNAERLPPPTKLSYEWLDTFTVNVSWSWKRPSNLPESCNIKFKYWREPATLLERRLTPWNYFTEKCLTEENQSSDCNYTIKATNASPCDGWTDSRPVNPAVFTPKPRAEVVKGFKCLFEAGGMNCSWTRVDPSHELNLSYRVCGQAKELKGCDGFYTSAAKEGCYFSVGDDTDICVHAATEAGAMTFKAVQGLHPPKLSVAEHGQSLHLSWPPPEVGKACVWIHEFCFTECAEEKERSHVPDARTCRNITREGGVFKAQVPYDKNCRYEFWSRVLTDKYCPQLSSDFGASVVFGVNVPTNRMQTVAAIIVPLILSVSVLLACYCFRRHSHIIFPTVPNPRVILKEMMNGNKELKFPAGDVYMPEAEYTDSLKLVQENSDPGQKL
ncbi:uncharacterized protein LOC129603228 [Betta splendens]|uniref:Uncharacterized protein LOC129603228 n=1 Tax=Betta splendens TaxID=158456 RepID=A0A9W2XC07_BETSP|nr:uncharacterized protein LOC129603228 [Betta splendens]